MCETDIPLAIISKTSAAGKRIPLVVGLPSITPGITVILFKIDWLSMLQI